jgi:hypothetical protein
MLEILNALCQLMGNLSKLVVEEKDPATKKGLLELFVMVSETIRTAPIDLKLNTGNKLVLSVTEEITASENIINEYKKKTRPIENLFDSLVKIMNELGVLFLKGKKDLHAPRKDF